MVVMEIGLRDQQRGLKSELNMADAGFLMARGGRATTSVCAPSPPSPAPSANPVTSLQNTTESVTRTKITLEHERAYKATRKQAKNPLGFFMPPLFLTSVPLRPEFPAAPAVLMMALAGTAGQEQGMAKNEGRLIKKQQTAEDT